MIDLRTCKPGDKLLSKHGMVLEYVEHLPDAYFPHIVKYPDGAFGSRCDDGHVFAKKRLEEDHDIIEILD